MRLVADEGVEREIVEQLRRDGFDVLYVAELDPGISDEQVLSHSNNETVLLITSDKDFGELVFRQKRVHAGVILIRLEGLSGLKKQLRFQSFSGNTFSEWPKPSPSSLRAFFGFEKPSEFPEHAPAFGLNCHV